MRPIIVILRFFAVIGVSAVSQWFQHAFLQPGERKRDRGLASIIRLDPLQATMRPISLSDTNVLIRNAVCERTAIPSSFNCRGRCRPYLCPHHDGHSRSKEIRYQIRQSLAACLALTPRVGYTTSARSGSIRSNKEAFSAARMDCFYAI